MEAEVIIAAVIGAIATIAAAIIGRGKIDKCKKTIRFLEENAIVRFAYRGENFEGILLNVKEICMYTVNSYELFLSFRSFIHRYLIFHILW